jgi:hypothetical protein
MNNFLTLAQWRNLAAGLLCLSVCTGNLWAQAGQQRPAKGERRGPPQEMIDACAGKAAGEVCSAVGPQGRNVEGTCLSCRLTGETCFAPPKAADAPLACRPSGEPREGGQGNRPEGAPQMSRVDHGPSGRGRI